MILMILLLLRGSRKQLSGCALPSDGLPLPGILVLVIIVVLTTILVLVIIPVLVIIIVVLIIILVVAIILVIMTLIFLLIPIINSIKFMILRCHMPTIIIIFTTNGIIITTNDIGIGIIIQLMTRKQEAVWSHSGH